MIILYYPKLCKPKNRRFPLSVLALAAVLEGREDYQIVDGNLEPDPDAVIRALCRSHRVELLAVSVMPGPQMVSAMKSCRILRVEFSRVPIVWGGYFPSVYKDAALNAEYVDFVGARTGREHPARADRSSARQCETYPPSRASPTRTPMVGTIITANERCLAPTRFPGAHFIVCPWRSICALPTLANGLRCTRPASDALSNAVSAPSVWPSGTRKRWSRRLALRPSCAIWLRTMVSTVCSSST